MRSRFDIVGFCFGLQQQHSKLYEEHFRPRAYTRGKTIDNKRSFYIGRCAKVHVLSHECKRMHMPGALFKAGKQINRLDKRLYTLSPLVSVKPKLSHGRAARDIQHCVLIGISHGYLSASIRYLIVSTHFNINLNIQ